LASDAQFETAQEALAAGDRSLPRQSSIGFNSVSTAAMAAASPSFLSAVSTASARLGVAAMPPKAMRASSTRPDLIFRR
jgi:hypothetical protein